MIEDKAKTKLSATESITTWMIRHAALAKHHSRDDITKTAQARFCHSDQLSMRRSETR